MDHDRLPTEPTASRGTADALVGAVLAGKYRVIELVARGGMGRIYRAEQAPLGREVALKILTRPALGNEADDAGLQKRFLLEAATCAKLVHPNTVRVFDYGAISVAGEPTLFMVMEFLRGKTLSQTLRADGPFSPPRVVRIACEMLRSLREAHKAGVVHRDLKPSNVMLCDGDEGEQVKVLDFGVAKVLSSGTEVLTSDGSFVGSPRYTAPEQIRQDVVDGRADLYALGVVMFELLAGKPPFSSPEPVRTLLMHLNEPVPAFTVGVPANVDQMVRRLMEKRPEDRFDSADAAYEAMRKLRGSLGPELPELAVDPTWDDDAEQRGRTGSHSGVRGGVVAPDANASAPARRAPWLLLGVAGGVAAALGILVLGGGFWMAARPPAEAPAREEKPNLNDALSGLAQPAAPQRLRLVSSPPATAWVDGVDRGLTPVDLDVRAGELPPVVLRVDGYQDTPVDVAEMLANPAVVTLAPVPASTVRPKPAGKTAPPKGAHDDIMLER